MGAPQQTKTNLPIKNMCQKLVKMITFDIRSKVVLPFLEGSTNEMISWPAYHGCNTKTKMFQNAFPHFFGDVFMTFLYWGDVQSFLTSA